MSKIYVVSDYVDYEGSRMVKAFRSEEKAEAFKLECKTYHQTRVWGAEWFDMEEWLKNHPAGPGMYSVDGFRVDAVELV